MSVWKKYLKYNFLTCCAIDEVILGVADFSPAKRDRNDKPHLSCDADEGGICSAFFSYLS
jgi:hypothetical protein